MKLFFSLLCLAISCNLSAVSCEAIDRIRTHHELVPAFGSDAELDAPDPNDDNESFRVEQGTTVRITGVESCKDIYVNGAGSEPAVLELADGCELRCQTIVVFGQQAVFRIPTGSCRIVFRDLPFDEYDPQQFGNGIIVISGQVHWRGRDPRQEKAVVAGELFAGQNAIPLTSIPENWQAGDELWIPDTRHPQAFEHIEIVHIAQVDGQLVYLTEPLQHDHPLRLNQDGTADDPRFKIANVTQSIVLQSENPNGVRGHGIAMDHARIDIDGVTAVDMGRTTTDPLMPGLNQVGRYPIFHFHGCPGDDSGGEWQQVMRHFSIVRSPKLGLVLHHSSHFGLFEHFAIVGCEGGSLITETPNVYGNVFRDGICIGGSFGSGESLTSRAHRNLAGGDHWHCSVGLGLQSAMNEFHDIDIYNHFIGIGLVGHGTTSLLRPTVRGTHADPSTYEYISFTHGGHEREYPFLPSSDVRLWGNWKGIETWTNNCHPDTPRMFPGLEIVHSTIPTDFQDQWETYTEGWRILGDFKKIPDNLTQQVNKAMVNALDWKDGYRFGITVDGGELRGYPCAYDMNFDTEHVTFRDVDIECPFVMYQTLGHVQRHRLGVDISFTDCTFTPVNGTLRAIDMNRGYGLELWAGAIRSGPKLDRGSLLPMTIEFRPWADGRDLDIYHFEQHPSFALAPVGSDQYHSDWPAGVWTQQQLIDLGTPIYGAAVPDTAFQDPGVFGRFYANDVTPPPPTLEERVEQLEEDVQQLKEILMLE